MTPERRAELRERWLKSPGEYSVCIPARELTALLDTADERDQLAAAVERAQTVVNGPAAYLRVTASGLQTKVVSVIEIIRALDPEGGPTC